MSEFARFPFTAMDADKAGINRMPFLPITLSYNGRDIAASGLLDSGATVNVLPHSLGVQLDLIWEQQRTAVILSGNLARIPARGILVSATVGAFAPVRLAFAWAQTDEVPLILGQANFFAEFDVCFLRSQAVFDIKPKTGE